MITLRDVLDRARYAPARRYAALVLATAPVWVVSGSRTGEMVAVAVTVGVVLLALIDAIRIPAPGHVTLESATVSRRHARLEYASGVWKVANLSRTNAVVVNDEALSLNRERTLSDGDRLELGEVVLRFHAR